VSSAARLWESGLGEDERPPGNEITQSYSLLFKCLQLFPDNSNYRNLGKSFLKEKIEKIISSPAAYIESLLIFYQYFFPMWCIFK